VVEKYYALYLLGRLHSEKGAPLLLGALQSKESGVRAGAVRGLKYMMKPEYVQPVAGLLTDPVRDIRLTR
jgi:HEAT repeat protein